MKTSPSRAPLLLLVAGAVTLCMAGCSTNTKRAPIHTHPVAMGKPTVFFEEGRIDTEPCCEVWGDRMPKLFGTAHQGAALPAVSLER